METSSEIEVIIVHNINSLPRRYIPFGGTPGQAKAAIYKDREREPNKRKYPDVDTVYMFQSQLLSWWNIVAISLEKREQQPISIIVEEDNHEAVVSSASV